MIDQKRRHRNADLALGAGEEVAHPPINQPQVA
jgi:hypothetical protein